MHLGIGSTLTREKRIHTVLYLAYKEYNDPEVIFNIGFGKKFLI